MNQQDQPSRPKAPTPRAIYWTFNLLSALAMLVMAALVLSIVTIYTIANATSHNSDTKTLPARERNLAHQFMMLELTNQARTEAGAPPLILGQNPAAQIHADQSAGECGGGHWDRHGLKPYMRYSLSGGYHQNGENWFSRSTCGSGSIWYNPATSPETALEHAVQAFLTSPGHREELLNPHYQKVNIGLAWNRQTFVAVQLFESDYLTFETLPSIQENQLHLKASLDRRARFSPNHPPLILVSYDPPPRPLNNAQITRTGCYQPGTPILRLLPAQHPEQPYTLAQDRCPDPHQEEPPSSTVQVRKNRKSAPDTKSPHSITVLFHQADEWNVTLGSVKLNADLSETLQARGPGIYTLSIYAEVQHQQVKVADFAIFHQVKAPEQYLRLQRQRHENANAAASSPSPEPPHP